MLTSAQSNSNGRHRNGCRRRCNSNGSKEVNRGREALKANTRINTLTLNNGPVKLSLLYLGRPTQ